MAVYHVMFTVLDWYLHILWGYRWLCMSYRYVCVCVWNNKTFQSAIVSFYPDILLMSENSLHVTNSMLMTYAKYTKHSLYLSVRYLIIDWFLVIVFVLYFQTSHVTVAQVACDSLLLLCDKADVLLELYPNVPSKIIQVNNIKIIHNTLCI